MCYENNNKVFTVVIRCAFVDGHLSIKEEVITRFEIKMEDNFNDFKQGKRPYYKIFFII